MSVLWKREVLLTHSITGKMSNAHKERDAKPALDPEKVQSICGELTDFPQMYELIFLGRVVSHK